MSSDGTRVAVGAQVNDGNGDKAGHVRVYEYDATKTSAPAKWTQLGGDIDGEASGDESSWALSISLDGTRVAIGAPTNDGNGGDSGHVRIYEYDATKTSAPAKWAQVGGDIDGEASNDRSGVAVSLSSDGTRVAIGAVGNDGINGRDSGHVRVYEYDATKTSAPVKWAQVGGDIDGEAVDDMIGDWKKCYVWLSSGGTRVAIGAVGNDGNGVNSGHVRVYEYDATKTSAPVKWAQVGGDIDGEAAGDQFGNAVSMTSDGKRVAIGGRSNDGTGTDAGHVRVYDLQAPPCTTSQYLKDGSCVACPPSTGVSSSHPSATSTGGSATSCTCPENYYAFPGIDAPTGFYDWACAE